MALRDNDESLLSRVRSCGGPVPEVPEPDVDESGLVQLLYTSGTTSAPKGAMMSHRALVHEYFSTIVALDLTGNDAPLHVMPLYHSAGMRVDDAVPGGRRGQPTDAVRRRHRHPRTDRGDPGHLHLLAPTVWVPLSQHEDFARRDLSSLRKAIYGASIMPVPVLERLQKALPQLGFYNAFGQARSVRWRQCCARGSTLRDPRPAGGRCSTWRSGSSTAMVNPLGGQAGRGGLPVTAAVRRVLEQTGNDRGGLPRRLVPLRGLGVDRRRGFITVVDRIKDVVNTGGVLVASRGWRTPSTPIQASPR